MNPEILIIGCGFLGEAAAGLFSASGRRVLGINRTPRGTGDCLADSFEIAACDITSGPAVRALAPKVQGADLAIHAVSSGGAGAESYAALYRDGLARILDAWHPKRVIFVSSTSVYAQTDGSWVTEESPTEPDRETGRILLEAERTALAAGGSVVRLSGIYGPGRSVLLRKFLSGEAVLEKEANRWINQVHRDDAAAALFSLGTFSAQSGIFNVSDDTPATQRDVYGWMADVLNRPLPPEGVADRNRKRGWTSKKVSNQKFRSMGWSPRFPSYCDALPLLISPDFLKISL
jgi:nucleoside-diphosphate-sugar epimerase